MALKMVNSCGTFNSVNGTFHQRHLLATKEQSRLSVTILTTTRWGTWLNFKRTGTLQGLFQTLLESTDMNL